jgi:hypothetical protein
MRELLQPESKTSPMKCALRNQSVAFTALAAIALSLSACSGAEGAELGAADSEIIENGAGVSDPVASVTSVPAAAETAVEQAQPIARAEQPQTATASREEGTGSGLSAPSDEAERQSAPVQTAEETAPAAAGSPASEPAPAPIPAEPAPSEIAPTSQPALVEPAPVEPAPVEPAPVEPAPVEPAPVEPAPAPVEPAPVEPAPAPVEPTTVHTNTMRVVGNRLFDTCGQPFVVRGVEQILGEQLPQGNDWLGLVQEIASTGANAVRILPGVNTLSVENIDELLTFVGAQGMVAFIDPLESPDDWYARADVRAMLKKHESFLIIDAYGEPQYDDIEKWRAEAKEALVHMRALGYEVPFTVYANQYGRGLPSLFDHGAEILALDPLQNTFLGWQAYWGNNGYYQEHYGYTLEQAVDAIVASGLPIQLGLDHITDMPSTEADYGTLMQGAEENGIGWLWWDFYNPYGAENNLSQDGTAENLTLTGADVIESHAASIANTARRACGR